MARFAGCSNTHASVAEMGASGWRACVNHPMPCQRRIDEFFDGSGKCAMIGSIRNGTLGSVELQNNARICRPNQALFESQQIRTLPL